MKIRENNLLLQEIDGEAVILDSLSGKIHKLNPVAHFVWQGLAEMYTIQAIVDSINEGFTGCERSQVARDVEQCIGQFRELGLIETDC